MMQSQGRCTGRALGDWLPAGEGSSEGGGSAKLPESGCPWLCCCCRSSSECSSLTLPGCTFYIPVIMLVVEKCAWCNASIEKWLFLKLIKVTHSSQTVFYRYMKYYFQRSVWKVFLCRVRLQSKLRSSVNGLI